MIMKDFRPAHFSWRVEGTVAHVTLTRPEQLEADALALAKRLADGPNFAHMMTKTMLGQECSMSLKQAICMQTQDLKRAYEAFVAKSSPRFAGD